MTSIRHYGNPHIVKLDGRYKGYNRGFRYRVEFNTYKNDKWTEWMNVVKWCENTWGKESRWSEDIVPRRLWNDNYRTEFGKNKHHRILYLCREQDLTMMLLVIN